MRFLILINGAPYKRFFSGLGKALEESGHTVVFAVDAKRSFVMEPDDFVDSRAIVFTEHFSEANRRLEEFSQSYSDDMDSWGDVFFSDFDRFFVYNKQLRKPYHYWVNCYLALKEFFSLAIENNRIDAVIYENVSNSFAYIAYRVAKKHGVKYIGLMAARIPGRHEIHSSIAEESKKIKEIYDSMDEITEEEKFWVNRYFEDIREIQPDYMKYNKLQEVSLTRKYMRLDKISKIILAAKAQFVLREEHYFSYQYGKPLAASWGMFRRSAARAVRKCLVKKYYSKPPSHSNYYVYPMHYHPESSTSVLAPNYVNEFENIKNIAFSLPMGLELVVKDHMSAFALQSLDFYKAVRMLPNVRIVSYMHNIKDLISSSRGLVTITSTAGFEAVALGKPVFCLGRVFYECFPGIIPIQNYDELKGKLGEKKQREMSSEEERKKWFVAYRRYTKEGELNMIKGMKDYRDILKNILEECRMHVPVGSGLAQKYVKY